MKEAKSLLEIMKCFLNEKECTIHNDIDENKLYRLAKVNSVSNFLQSWAQEYCKTEELKKQIDNDYISQIVKDTNQNIEVEKILSTLEQNNIKTLVVKGVLMKDIYPQNYMRQMCDIDILVNDIDFKKATKIMQNIGFKKFHDEEKHLIFTKPPFIIVELHRKLILQKDIVGYEYFNDIWPLCIPYKNYQNIYQLDLENAYVFCIVHLLVHFKFMGIKIKDILDVYLYNKHYQNILDYDKIDNIFKDLHISDFAENIKSIAYKWFGTDKIDDFNEVETFILNGSNLNNSVNYSLGKSTGKFNYLIELLFPEMKIMKEKYPILEKFPPLLPFMWITRIFKNITPNAIPLKQRFHTIKLIKEADTEEIEKVKNIYHKLGVK